MGKETGGFMTTENKHVKAIKVLKEHCNTLLDMNTKNAEMFGDMGIMDQIRYEAIAEIERTIKFLEAQQ